MEDNIADTVFFEPEKVREPANEINFWLEEYENLKRDFSNLCSNKNDLYRDQLNELSVNNEKKKEMLELWKTESEKSIDRETEVKIDYLIQDCEKKINEIPQFLMQSIQKNFARLRKEFTDVFELFLQQDIPFINEFSNPENIKHFYEYHEHNLSECVQVEEGRTL